MNRKEEILRLLEEGYTTAKELARYFNVSLMTIYRDLKELEEEGRIIRRHGSVELKREEDLKGEGCVLCGKEIDNRLAFTYILKGGKKVHTCCPHCGLLAFPTLEKERIEMIFSRDFIYCNPINALSAFYVVGGDVSPCCLPPAFVFADKGIAERFAKGFGGEILSFEEAVKRMQDLMKKSQRVNFSP